MSSDDGQPKRMTKATGPGGRGEGWRSFVSVVAADVSHYQVVAVVLNPGPRERPGPPSSLSLLLWAPVTSVSSRHPANKFLFA